MQLRPYSPATGVLLLKISKSVHLPLGESAALMSCGIPYAAALHGALAGCPTSLAQPCPTPTLHPHILVERALRKGALRVVITVILLWGSALKRYRIAELSRDCEVLVLSEQHYLLANQTGLCIESCTIKVVTRNVTWCQRLRYWD